MMKNVYTSKDYDIWIYKIVYVIWKIAEEKCPHIKKFVYIEHRIVYIPLKIVYNFWKYGYWIYKIVYIF